MAFGSDVGRRVLPIRLQSPLETPENRSGFVHPNLLAWIESKRPRTCGCCFDDLRAYFVARCPIQSGGEWGSFESWSAKIRGAIVWAGGADPLPTRATALAGDDTAALLVKLIEGIEQADPYGNGLTTKQILEKDVWKPRGLRRKRSSCRSGVRDLRRAGLTGDNLGGVFDGFAGRVHGGQFIVAESAGGGVCRWRVETCERWGLVGQSRLE